MDQVTAKVLVDGVRDIAVASLNKTPMNPNDLGAFLSKISESLVGCLKDADAVISSSSARTEAAAPVEQDERRVEEAASAVAEAPAQQTAAAPQEKTRKKVKPKAEAVSASEAETLSAEAPAAETPAGSPVVEVAPAAEAQDVAPATAASDAASVGAAVAPEKKKRKTGYKFAHISRVPVVPVKDSVSEDTITCLIDGEKRKMLHRHLRSKYDMSEAEYRKHFKLPADYPMTAPGYSKEKRLVAIDQGLGKKEQPTADAPEPAKVTKRQRSRKVPAEA